MYQNLVMTPLTSLNGRVSHVCLMVQDVSDVANSKLQLRDSNERLSTMSRTDGLTGLFNRAHWEFCLSREYENAQLLTQPSTLVIFDIDHFKTVNDTY
ncbi:diguanylate cyclase, partial [Vibrio sp. D173a]|uniref:GGDEF domain-containing protein n=1 Tax=Vibrio sp. D173a TaxID=2836349 RepID=UPI002555985C